MKFARINDDIKIMDLNGFATINDYIYYSRIISMNDGENYKGKTLLFAFYDDYPPYYNHD